jgi:hypothetical protein
MKRIFTLLLATGFVSLLQAQPGQRRPDHLGQQQQPVYDRNDDRLTVNLSFDLDDDRYNDRRIYNTRKRDALIAKINRVYDQRIQRVRNNYFMNRWEKQDRIYRLERQRRDEIGMVYLQYSNRNHHGRYSRF